MQHIVRCKQRRSPPVALLIAQFSGTTQAAIAVARKHEERRGIPQMGIVQGTVGINRSLSRVAAELCQTHHRPVIVGEFRRDTHRLLLTCTHISLLHVLPDSLAAQHPVARTAASGIDVGGGMARDTFYIRIEKYRNGMVTRHRSAR